MDRLINSKNNRKNKRLFLVNVLLLLSAIPIFLTIIFSLFSSWEVEALVTGGVNKIKTSLYFIPYEFSFGQYISNLLLKGSFLKLYWNSIIYLLIIIVFQTLISISGAYVLAFHNFVGKHVIYITYIIVMLLPIQVTLVASYILFDSLNMIGNTMSIILPGIFSTFGIFFLRQVFCKISFAQIEAARIEGAKEITILYKIVIPQSIKSILVMIFVSFVEIWNMVEQPLIFLKDRSKYPLSIYLKQVINDDVGIAFSASVLFFVLPIFLMFIVRKIFIESIRDNREREQDES